MRGRENKFEREREREREREKKEGEEKVRELFSVGASEEKKERKGKK